MELKFTGASSHARRFEVPSPLNDLHILVLIWRTVTKLVVDKVDSIADILRRHPGLTTLRDPPHLAGQRVHYAMVFHFDREGTPKRSLMRSRAWTDLSIRPDHPKNVKVKKRSKVEAEGIFNVAKMVFDSDNPDEIRDKVTADMLMEFMI